ncbi:MAG TPA: hypothetical protein VMV72_10975 [Verrucomicrobiae bacterium]|nr:hypothetical protein [Verrucomicrobiae bacterium]
MITRGSISRESAARAFPFLAEFFEGRRNAIRELTHRDPEFAFWIHPDGQLHDARDSHRDNVPKGYEHILRDEPDYCGFLRGRVVRFNKQQLIVVYCRVEALAESESKIRQFARGLQQMPLPIDLDALVISDNADIFGTVADIIARRPTASSGWG